MITQEDEHREIVRAALEDVLKWAKTTDQVEEAQAVANTIKVFDWWMALEHLIHYAEAQESYAWRTAPVAPVFDAEPLIAICEAYTSDS